MQFIFSPAAKLSFILMPALPKGVCVGGGVVDCGGCVHTHMHALLLFLPFPRGCACESVHAPLCFLPEVEGVGWVPERDRPVG